MQYRFFFACRLDTEAPQIEPQGPIARPNKPRDIAATQLYVRQHTAVVRGRRGRH
jgi:hypothetical protein